MTKGLMRSPTLSDIESAIEFEAAKKQPDLSVIKELIETSKTLLQGAGADKPFTDQERVSQVIKEESGPGQFRIGMGTVLPRAAQGLRGIFTDVPKEEIDELKMVEQATPLTRLGSIGGETLGGFALPIRSLSLIPGVKSLPGLGSRIGQSAEMGITAGGVNAAITPENRGTAAAFGVAGGGIPALFGIGQRILPEGRMGGVSGPQIIGETIARDVPNDVSNLIAALRGGYKDFPGVKGTSAVITGDPTMQVLESGSRVRRPELWRPFDAENAQARYAELLSRAGTPEEMAALQARRDKVTKEARLRAITSAKSLEPGEPLGISAMIPAVEKELDILATGEFRPNPSVQAVVKYVKGQIEDPRGISPEQLYEIRKVITSKIVPGDALSSAASGARAQTVGLVKSIDDSLDSLSYGSWSRYLKQYGIESKSINSREALQDVIDKISRGMGAENVPPSLKGYGGELPFGRVVESNTFKQFGSKKIDLLLPEDRALVEALKTDLLRSSQAMNVRAMGGPGTATEIASGMRTDNPARVLANQAAAGIGGMVGGVPGAITGQLATNIVNRALMHSSDKGQEILVRLLQNPEYMATVLEKARRTQKQMDIAKRFGGAAGTGATGYKE
jgi:hypothetical protein